MRATCRSSRHRRTTSPPALVSSTVDRARVTYRSLNREGDGCGMWARIGEFRLARVTGRCRVGDYPVAVTRPLPATQALHAARDTAIEQLLAQHPVLLEVGRLFSGAGFEVDDEQMKGIGHRQS